MQTRNKLVLAGMSILGLLAVGTIFYHYAEGWGWIDSFYFTGVTLLTIGYGDLHPTTDASKIFTVLFALGGVTTFLFSLTTIEEYYTTRRQEIFETKMANYLEKIGQTGMAPAKMLGSKIRQIIKR
ncbi:MAG: potassium channel family protein [archaeon]|nr:potassium channel family protein [archaeon]